MVYHKSDQFLGQPHNFLPLHFFAEGSNFSQAGGGGTLIRTLGRVSRGEASIKMSRFSFLTNKCIFSNLNIINLKISPTMVVYTGFRENLTINLERDKTYKVYRSMRGDILEDNPEGIVW